MALSLHAEMIAEDIRREGSPSVLTRYTGVNDIHFDVALPAVWRGAPSTTLAQETVQGQNEVRISPKELLDAQWPAPPRVSDQIRLVSSDRPSRVMDVDILEISGEVVEYVLQVRG